MPDTVRTICQARAYAGVTFRFRLPSMAIPFHVGLGDYLLTEPRQTEAK
jgi:hypothetical protein